MYEAYKQGTSPFNQITQILFVNLINNNGQILVEWNNSHHIHEWREYGLFCTILMLYRLQRLSGYHSLHKMAAEAAGMVCHQALAWTVCVWEATCNTLANIHTIYLLNIFVIYITA
jgi:hypothetical protein